MPPLPDGARWERSVGYLGPEGTFSEQALFASARAGAVEPVALATIHEAITAVESGALRWALVPIENALEGSVAVTLDLLAEHAGRIRIAGETVLAIHHALIARRPVELARIEEVLTHPQVPGQCSEFLRGELAAARIVPATSTAEAVRAVSQDDADGRAAIGTTLAAEIYGAHVLRERIEDHHDNETRFVWLRGVGDDADAPLASTATVMHTSLLFWGPGTEHAGWLVRCLDEFARREVNLTKIESRPRRGRLGTYMFFADVEGAADDADVAAAIDGLSDLCEEVRLLGSYPAYA
ncbi:MAG TPA: prephenate dehydratase [Solirubrobacteraceae bacterium]|nr:prephenate dehydratase [Solirubrobacteraceae bacterium]